MTKRLERDKEVLHRSARARAAEQPYVYPPQREWAEPDWTRIPAYRDVTAEQWGSARWQRQHKRGSQDDQNQTGKLMCRLTS